MVAAAAAIGAAGSILGGLFGGHGQKIPKTPRDLKPMRSSTIGLMNYLLGFNDPNAPWAVPQQQAPMGSGFPMGRYSPTGAPPYGQGPGGFSNGWGNVPGSVGAPGGQLGGGGGNGSILGSMPGRSAQPYTPTNPTGSGSQGVHPSFSIGGQGLPSWVDP